VSTLTIRILTCDGVDDGEVCPAEYGGDTDGQSFARLRQDAKALAGWTALAGRDYCPDHAAQARDDSPATEASTYLTVLRSVPAPAGGEQS
jgi:hypothetical protein